MQFFSESLLTVAFAFLVSLLLAQLTLTFFNEVANKQISILWDNPVFWLIGIGFIIITAFVAGSYPAFYLSSFNPVKVLKGTFKAGRYAAISEKSTCSIAIHSFGNVDYRIRLFRILALLCSLAGKPGIST